MLFRDEDQEWPAVAEVTDHVGVTHTVVTRHDLVKQVLGDPGTYGPDNALDAITPIPVAAIRVLTSHGFKLPPTLANNGSWSHPGIREITANALHPIRVEAARPWLTDLVRSRVNSFGEEIDLYQELAADIPLLVLARLVELPDSDAAVVKEFSRAALELFWAPVDKPRQVELSATVGRFHRILRDFAQTAGGMVGELRDYARAEGLSKDTPVGALFFLLVAGQETTSQFLTLLMHRLALEPHVLDSPPDDIVEEGLRLVPPIPTWRRLAAADSTLGGVTIPKGRSIVLWLARAGRDIAGPDFVPGQHGSRKHLAFGAGTHRCVGAHLSRMEASVVVTETASLLRNVDVVRAPWCPDNLSFRMPDSFVVRRMRVLALDPGLRAQNSRNEP